MAAQDEGGDQYQLAEARQPQQLAHPTSWRAHGRCGARVLQFRDSARGHGGRTQQQSLQSDDHGEAPGAHRLPRQQGTPDEGGGARPAHPAVLEPPLAAAGWRYGRAQR